MYLSEFKAQILQYQLIHIIAKVGGPQISSANRKYANLQTYQICLICGRLWQFTDCDLWTLCFLGFADSLNLPQICKT
jgi:hypothetical protein